MFGALLQDSRQLGWHAPSALSAPAPVGRCSRCFFQLHCQRLPRDLRADPPLAGASARNEPAGRGEVFSFLQVKCMEQKGCGLLLG